MHALEFHDTPVPTAFLGDDCIALRFIVLRFQVFERDIALGRFDTGLSIF